MKFRLEKKGARIELIPLIDIIFLLLVFFIYSMLSMVVYRGIPVNLPTAETTESQQDEILVVTIDAQGHVFLEKEAVTQGELRARLKDIANTSPERAIIISGHRDAPYRVFVDVLDQVRLAGCQKVSIEAKPKK